MGEEMRTKDKLNKFNAPWSFQKDEMSRWCVIVDKDNVPVGVTYIEADGKALAVFPELFDDLAEAAYEYCFKCMEMNDRPILDTCELIAKGCPEPDGKCFVQRWLKTLKKVHRAYANPAKKGKKK